MYLTDDEIRAKADAFVKSLEDGTFTRAVMPNSGTPYTREYAEDESAYFSRFLNSSLFDGVNVE